MNQALIGQKLVLDEFILQLHEIERCGMPDFCTGGDETSKLLHEYYEMRLLLDNKFLPRAEKLLDSVIKEIKK